LATWFTKKRSKLREGEHRAMRGYLYAPALPEQKQKLIERGYGELCQRLEAQGAMASDYTEAIRAITIREKKARNRDYWLQREKEDATTAVA
jgi:hypothetical protein